GYGRSRGNRSCGDGGPGSTQDIFNTHISRRISLSFPLFYQHWALQRGPRSGAQGVPGVLHRWETNFLCFSTVGGGFPLFSGFLSFVACFSLRLFTVIAI